MKGTWDRKALYGSLGIGLGLTCESLWRLVKDRWIFYISCHSWNRKKVEIGRVRLTLWKSKLRFREKGSSNWKVNEEENNDFIWRKLFLLKQEDPVQDFSIFPSRLYEEKARVSRIECKQFTVHKEVNICRERFFILL